MTRATMLAARAVELLGEMLSRLEVDAARMRANLDASGGAVLSEAIMLALAQHLGRDAAHRLMYDTALLARERGQTLIDTAQDNPVIVAAIGQTDLGAWLDPARHTGQCAAMVDRVLEGGA